MIFYALDIILLIVAIMSDALQEIPDITINPNCLLSGTPQLKVVVNINFDLIVEDEKHNVIARIKFWNSTGSGSRDERLPHNRMEIIAAEGSIKLFFSLKRGGIWGLTNVKTQRVSRYTPSLGTSEITIMANQATIAFISEAMRVTEDLRKELLDQMGDTAKILAQITEKKAQIAEKHADIAKLQQEIKVLQNSL